MLLLHSHFDRLSVLNSGLVFLSVETPENYYRRKNNRAARAARTKVHFNDVL